MSHDLSRRHFAGSLACGLASLTFAKTFRLRAASASDAIQGAVRFLADAQSRDGAWRSEVRGVFRDGDALTPLVLRTLQELPDNVRPRDAVARGLQWLNALAGRLQASSDPWSGLRYPLFTACHAARLGKDAGSPDFWTGLLRQLQSSNGSKGVSPLPERGRDAPATTPMPTNRNSHSELGWPDSDARSGGWSDASRPVRFTSAEGISDMNNPNLSATACALDGLVGAAHVEVRRSALAFIMRCQNFRSDAPANDKIDDGGFFFTLDDPIRNKAGVARTDADGRRRFRSYGSATCDGLLSLVACGLPSDHPRIQAAIRWLQRNAGGKLHSGKWPPSRCGSAVGLDFYFAQAYAKSLRWMNHSLPSLQSWCVEQQKKLASALLARQNHDGSWVNPEPESFEDDPLLATSFALMALTANNSV